MGFFGFQTVNKFGDHSGVVVVSDEHLPPALRMLLPEHDEQLVELHVFMTDEATGQR